MTITVYRYDNEDFPNGKVVPSRGDHFANLTGTQKIVETAMRAGRPDGANIRSTSLYTWEDRDIAERLWQLSKKKYLYELAIHEADIRHKGDVNNYSKAEDAVRTGNRLDDAVRKYWEGESAGPPYSTPRIEILVSDAKVLNKLRQYP